MKRRSSSDSLELEGTMGSSCGFVRGVQKDCIETNRLFKLLFLIQFILRVHFQS